MERMQTVVFLHGATVGAKTYQKLIGLLSINHRVIAPDLPGFGKTPAPAEIWGVADYAKWVDVIIKKENLNNVTLIGHSFGGGVAAYVAAANENVTKLILIDATGIPSDKNWGQFKLAVIKKILNGWKENPGMTNKIIFDSLTGWVMGHFKELPQTMTILKQIVTEKQELPKIKISTLILWGDHDEFFPVKCGEEWNKIIPDSELIVVPGNHDWCLFTPEKFLNIAFAKGKNPEVK